MATVGGEDYLANAVAVTGFEHGLIGVMRTAGDRPADDERGGSLYLGTEHNLYPDTIDALDGSHYHARIVLDSDRVDSETAREMNHGGGTLTELGLNAVREHLKTRPVPRRVQRDAARYGIAIPDPPIRLGPWTPANASPSLVPTDHRAERDALTLPYRDPRSALGAREEGVPPVIMKRADYRHPAADQLVAAALETENRLRRAAGRPPVLLAAENNDLEGYAAYDGHPYTRAELLVVKKMDAEPATSDVEAATEPPEPSPARAGWTVCLPIMVDDDQGKPVVTGHLLLASPVRYTGRTTGKRLMNGDRDALPKVGPDALRLTERPGEDPEATTDRLTLFLINSFGWTDADIPYETRGRPRADTALKLTETPRNHRRAMITSSIRQTLETYTTDAPGQETVIRSRRRAADGKIVIDVQERAAAPEDEPPVGDEEAPWNDATGA